MIKLSMYILIQQGCVAQIGKTHRHTNKYTDRQTDMANAVMQVEENDSILFKICTISIACNFFCDG